MKDIIVCKDHMENFKIIDKRTILWIYYETQRMRHYSKNKKNYNVDLLWNPTDETLFKE